MTVMLLQFEVAEEKAAEVEVAGRSLVAEITDEAPEGVRYAVSRVADTSTFVAVLELADGVENPLPALDAGRQFQLKVKELTGEQQFPRPLEVVGSYRLFD